MDTPATTPAKLCSGTTRTRLCATCIDRVGRESATLAAQSQQLASCGGATVEGAAAASSQLLDAALKRSVDILEPLVKAKLNCIGVVRPLAPLLNATSAGEPKDVCHAAGALRAWQGVKAGVVLKATAFQRP